MKSLAAVVVAAIAAITACTGGHTTSVSATSRTPFGSGFPSTTVTPSYGGPTGPTNCGAWALAATTPLRSYPVLSCAETAGPTPVTVKVKVGDEIVVSGFNFGTTPRIKLVPIPARLVEQSGRVFLAKSAGQTTVDVTGLPCSPTQRGQQATTCPLLMIVAS